MKKNIVVYYAFVKLKKKSIVCIFQIISFKLSSLYFSNKKINKILDFALTILININSTVK